MTAALNGGTRAAATAVTVSVGASRTATSGTDFAAVSGFTITIPANTASATGTFSLDPTQDSIDEADETVSVTGTTTVSGLSVSGTLVTITDDDATPAVTLVLTPATVAESDDTGTAVAEHRTTVTATLGGASSAATEVTVSVAPADAGAVALSVNKVLTIAAGATSSTGAVTVEAVDNDIDAADRTVTVKGAAFNTLGATDPADEPLTITDDDTRGVTVSETSLEFAEGGSSSYTVVLGSELPVASVDRSHVSKLHFKMRDKPAQANHTVDVLSKMFSLAEAWSMTPPRRNPCRSVRLYKKNRRERFLTPEEYRRLGRVLDEAETKGGLLPSGIAAIRLLLLTGCRKNEIVTLRWDDIDRTAGEIRLRDSKTGARRIPLTPAVEWMLADIPRIEGNPWVITGKLPGDHLKNLDQC